jgi:hypothetical protein
MRPGMYDTSYDGHQCVFISRLNRYLGALLTKISIGKSCEGTSILIVKIGEIHVRGYALNFWHKCLQFASGGKEKIR